MEVNKGIFIKAAVATLALFAISLFVGYSIESDNYSRTEARVSQLESGLETSLLFLMFMQTHNQSDAMCSVLKSQLDDSAQRTYDLYGILEQGKETGIFIGYQDLRNKYFLANMQFYLMLRQYMQTCGNTNLEPILFFYTAYNDCPSCVAQGRVLDSVRAECSNARVYAFPADVQDVTMIKYFTKYYQVGRTPALVINDQRYDDLLTKDRIEALINCSK
ncbi:MAG: hypothetical protein PHV13_01835 [Candidatus ainarchaeum sp.]|nr:hypothetical protein [Candidatus ainarchaeum sp.]